MAGKSRVAARPITRPARVVLKIDQREYRPTVIDRIVFAGAGSESGAKAARVLLKLAGLKISARDVLRITPRSRSDRSGSRSASTTRCCSRVASCRPRTRRRSRSRACRSMADGCGRMRTDAPGQGRGVREHAWKETKIAARGKRTGPMFNHDPPRAFLDPQHIPQMVREIKRPRGESHERDETAEKTGSTPLVVRSVGPSSDGDSREREWPPQRVFRTCVATLQDVYGLAPSSRRRRSDAAALTPHDTPAAATAITRTGPPTNSTSRTSSPSPTSSIR